MSWLLDVKLMPLFDFYLALAFAASTVLRIRQYLAVLGLIRTFPQRWPKLLSLVKQHGHIFLTWRTFGQLGASLALLLAQTFASRRDWPQAQLTVNEILP